MLKLFSTVIWMIKSYRCVYVYTHTYEFIYIIRLLMKNICNSTDHCKILIYRIVFWRTKTWILIQLQEFKQNIPNGFSPSPPVRTFLISVIILSRWPVGFTLVWDNPSLPGLWWWVFLCVFWMKCSAKDQAKGHTRPVCINAKTFITEACVFGTGTGSAIA